MRIVLAHGFPGFGILHAGPVVIEYFRGVAAMLRDRGFEVFTPAVEPLGILAERAEQLDRQIPTSGQRVHIIGHSGGGLDARFLVSPGGRNQAQRVASITTICTPHRGTPIADVAAAISGLALRALFPRIDEAVRGFEPHTISDFDRRVPDADGVRYFSYAADLSRSDFGPLASFYLLPHGVVQLQEGKNDAWVSVTSARRGEFKEALPTDHTGIVGWSFSASGIQPDPARFDPFGPLPSHRRRHRPVAVVGAAADSFARGGKGPLHSLS